MIQRYLGDVLHHVPIVRFLRSLLVLIPEHHLREDTFAADREGHNYLPRMNERDLLLDPRDCRDCGGSRLNGEEKDARQIYCGHDLEDCGVLEGEVGKGSSQTNRTLDAEHHDLSIRCKRVLR